MGECKKFDGNGELHGKTPSPWLLEFACYKIFKSPFNFNIMVKYTKLFWLMKACCWPNWRNINAPDEIKSLVIAYTLILDKGFYFWIIRLLMFKFNVNNMQNTYFASASRESLEYHLRINISLRLFWFCVYLLIILHTYMVYFAYMVYL